MQLTDWLRVEVALLLIGLTKISFAKNWFFLLAIHSHNYSFALRFYFFKLTQPLIVSVKEKRKKPDRIPYPLPYSLRNPYRNLKTETSQDYAQKPKRNCTFMNSASGYRDDFPHF